MRDFEMTVRSAILGSLLMIGAGLGGCSAGSSGVPGSSLAQGGASGSPAQANAGSGQGTGGVGSSLGGATSSGGQSTTGGTNAGGSGAGCLGSTVACGNQCVDLSSDATHCGSCGHACSAGQTCSGGNCACTTGTLCGSNCVNTQADAANCGSCGHACTSGQACNAGNCVCTSGSFCGSLCVNTQIDGNNCGSCGHACPTGQSCSSGSCACSSGALCNGSCVNLSNDNNNCGSCGTQCSGGRSCSSGSCACTNSLTWCGSSCVNTQTSASNCGACGKVCSTGQTCSSGSCTGGGSSCPSPDNVGLVGWATQGGGTTGGGTASSTTVTSLSALNSAAGGSTARVVVVSGTISGNVTIGSNKTIVGACGGAATIKGHIQMQGSKNVILKNLKVVGYNCTDSPSDCSAGADAITIENSAAHIWIDHCDISDGSDGNTDITHASDYITISWTKFHYSGTRSGGHQFSNLIGHSDSNSAEDTGHLRVTFHHVWWADHVDQRQPRVRFGQVHIFNSLYTSSGDTYCVGVGADANILLENNVFIGVRNPIDTSDVAATPASVCESSGNVFTNCTGSKSAVGSGNAFNPPYSYTLDAASGVQSAVQSGVGPK